jgi:hypothetical protein
VRPTFRVSRFDVSDVLNQGTSALNRAVKKLRHQLVGLKHDAHSPLYLTRAATSSEQTRPGSTAAHSRDSHGGRPPLPIIFVTHSLGFWVMKNALIPPISPSTHCFHPTGVVLLDGDARNPPRIADSSQAGSVGTWGTPSSVHSEALTQTFGVVRDTFRHLEHNGGGGAPACSWSLDDHVVSWEVWAEEHVRPQTGVSTAKSLCDGSLVSRGTGQCCVTPRCGCASRCALW